MIRPLTPSDPALQAGLQAHCRAEGASFLGKEQSQVSPLKSLSLQWASVTCPPIRSVSSLPAGATAGWDLCFDQAVVFIEDAVQVGSAGSRWPWLGLSLGPWGLSDGRPDDPFAPCCPGLGLRLADRVCGQHKRRPLGSSLKQRGAGPPVILIADSPPTVGLLSAALSQVA